MQRSQINLTPEVEPHWLEAQRFGSLAHAAGQDASTASQRVERLAETCLSVQTDEESRLIEDSVKRAHANTAKAVGFAAQVAALVRATRRAGTAKAAKALAGEAHATFNLAELHAVRAEGDLAEARKVVDKVKVRFNKECDAQRAEHNSKLGRTA